MPSHIHPNFILDQQVDEFFKRHFEVIYQNFMWRIRKHRHSINEAKVRNRVQLKIFDLKEQFSIQLKKYVCKQLEGKRQQCKQAEDHLSEGEINFEVSMFKMKLIEIAIRDFGSKWLQNFIIHDPGNDDKENLNSAFILRRD